MTDEPLHRLLSEEVQREVPGAVSALAARLAAKAGGRAAAVLFYGSNLRDERLEGVLDFYVLLDDVAAWPQPRLAAWGNRWLPPNVGYLEDAAGSQLLRAKIAVISVAQFARGVDTEALDTTLWARFSQPCRCVWSRSEADRSAAIAAVRQAVITAARWSAELGPERGAALDYWRALFARTYRAELRVETGGRASDLVARDAPRYERALPEAWRAAGITFKQSDDGSLTPDVTPASRQAAERRWRLRQDLGKPLNVLRLIKASFTFDGAMDYVAWKVERHSGIRPEITDWQRRHPLLAAPGLYWRLRRLKVLS